MCSQALPFSYGRFFVLFSVLCVNDNGEEIEYMITKVQNDVIYR